MFLTERLHLYYVVFILFVVRGGGSVVIQGLERSYYVLVDVLVDNCKLVSAQFSAAPLTELISNSLPSEEGQSDF